MIHSLILVVSILVIVGAAYARRKRHNMYMYRKALGNVLNAGVDPGRLYRNAHSVWVFEKVFGVYFAAGSWLGNCFQPAVVLEWHGWSPRIVGCNGKRFRSCVLSLTFRYRHKETTLYWHGLAMRWNSEHLARRWGKWSGDEAAGIDAWVYKGWMGVHHYI